MLTEAVSHTDILDDEDALREPDGECDDESEEEIDGDDDTDVVQQSGQHGLADLEALDAVW